MTVIIGFLMLFFGIWLGRNNNTTLALIGILIFLIGTSIMLKYLQNRKNIKK